MVEFNRVLLRWLKAGLARLGLLGAAVIAQADAADEAMLRVQPDLCMITAQQPSCSLAVTIDWRAPRVADYCVRGGVLDAAGATAATTPSGTVIDCWQQTDSGVTSDHRQVEQSFTYLLVQRTGDRADTPEVARAAVSVFSARSNDRRRNRQRRHVWSVL